MERRVAQIVTGQDTSDGGGVRLRRIIGSRALDRLDPFLLLDEFRSDRADDYIAGFPSHPHRGFETVTYMLAGRMRHKDSRGNEGTLAAGSVQWMTAGRGIVHSEMPEPESGLMWGFQLWVNLPAKDKLCAPRYQDIAPEGIPEVATGPGARVRVIAGAVGEVVGPVREIVTRPTYLDVRLEAGASFEYGLPAGHAAAIYVYDGRARIAVDASVVGHGQLAVLADGDRVRATADSEGARMLLLAAMPMGEPVARLGPFVMNTKAEIMQAVRDYETGALAI